MSAGMMAAGIATTAESVRPTRPPGCDFASVGDRSRWRARSSVYLDAAWVYRSELGAPGRAETRHIPGTTSNESKMLPRAAILWKFVGMDSSSRDGRKATSVAMRWIANIDVHMTIAKSNQPPGRSSTCWRV